MQQAVTLFFFCGKMASGKSTLARKLAQDYAAILLVEDELLAKLYAGEITDIPTYIQYSWRLKDAISDHISALLSRGVSVVLDFPANTREQRQWFRMISENTGAIHELHFIDACNELCKRQLAERSKDKPEGSAFTSEQDFEAITQYFQPPSVDEGFHTIVHQRV